MNVCVPPLIAGWSSLVARQAHNLKVAGSNPAPAPNLKPPESLPGVSWLIGYAFSKERLPAVQHYATRGNFETQKPKKGPKFFEAKMPVRIFRGTFFSEHAFRLKA